MAQRSILDFLFGSSPEIQQATTVNPQQEALQQQLISQLMGTTGQGMDWLKQLLSGDESAFADFEAPMKRQFEREVIPGISERFAGMGSGGAQDSSAFHQSLGSAGRDLTTNLASLRSGLKMNALQQLQSLMSPAYQKSFENVYDPGSYGVVGGALQSAAQGAGKAAGQAGAQYFLA